MKNMRIEWNNSVKIIYVLQKKKKNTPKRYVKNAKYKKNVKVVVSFYIYIYVFYSPILSTKLFWWNEMTI